MKSESGGLKVALSCVLVGSLLLSARGAEVSVAKAWPCWRGADGSGWMPCDTPLIRDMSKMKLVWESEEKQMSGSYFVIMGGAGGPVIADGKVFFTYMWPSGDLDQDYFVKCGKNGKMEGRELKDVEKFAAATGMTQEEFIRTKSLLRSDDVVIAMDLATGKTMWKQVFKDRYNNVGKSVRGFFKFSKTGPHIIACAAFGKVATIGSGGDVYCMDAASGKVLWEKKKFHGPAPKYGIADGAMTFAGGLFIASHGGGQISGLDPETGTDKWTAKTTLGGEMMPIRWVNGGQEYIISGTTCVDAKTGKVLWNAPEAANCTTPAVSGDLVVFTGWYDMRSKTGTGLNCYRMTREKAEKVWTTDVAYSAGGWCTPVIAKGTVMVKAQRGRTGGDRGAIVCLDLATGNPLGEVKTGSDSCGSMIAIGDLLQYDGDWYDANPKSFSLLGSGPEPQGDVRMTFTSSHTPAPAGGSRIIIRGQNSLRCYDLAVQ